MVDDGRKNGSCDHTKSMIDLDGTLTGESGFVVMQRGLNITEGLECKDLAGWNMQACKQQFVAVSDVNYTPPIKLSISGKNCREKD